MQSLPLSQGTIKVQEELRVHLAGGIQNSVKLGAAMPGIAFQGGSISSSIGRTVTIFPDY
jgi:hypothetical protein